MCLFKRHKKKVLLYNTNNILDIMCDICIDKDLSLDTKIELLKLFQKLL